MARETILIASRRRGVRNTIADKTIAKVTSTAGAPITTMTTMMRTMNATITVDIQGLMIGGVRVEMTDTFSANATVRFLRPASPITNSKAFLREFRKNWSVAARCRRDRRKDFTHCQAAAPGVYRVRHE